MGAIENSGALGKSHGLLMYNCKNYQKVEERKFQSGGDEGTLAIAGHFYLPPHQNGIHDLTFWEIT